MSRYDYRDPGTDPRYCDGLSDLPEPEDVAAVEARRRERLAQLDAETVDDDAECPF